MAQITTDINNADIARTVDAFAKRFRYDMEKLPGETKAQFAKRMVAKLIKQIVLEQELEDAKAAIVTPSEIDAT